MRKLPAALLPLLASGLVCLSACNDGEPPPLDSGVDASRDGGGQDVAAPDGSPKIDSTLPDSSHPDATAADHRAPGDVVTASDAKHDAQADGGRPDAHDAGFCGDSGAACTGATTCTGGVCVDCGGPGEPCCGSGTCVAGTICSAQGYCTECGNPGEECCPATTCNDGGCCLANVCAASGSACPGLGGFFCNNSSCGYLDGGQASCGGPGQECCSVSGSGSGSASGTGSCTAPHVACTATTAAKVCEACGGAGQTCCEGTTCVGSSTLLCSNQTCVACGGAGEPCCLSTVDGGACGATFTCGSDLRCQ